MRTCTLVVIAGLAGCGPTASSPDDLDGGGGGGDGFLDGGGGGTNEFIDAAPPQACAKMDIVFVVDDSLSMLEEQGNLATNFPAFVQVLDAHVTPSGDALDYRAAVTTVSRNLTIEYDDGFPPELATGPSGAFVMTPGCSMTRRWVERADPGVGSTFACNAQVGTNGNGMEQPLDCLTLALGARVTDGTNAGFLRDDALLAIVILTDEDDSSVTPEVTTVLADPFAPGGGIASPPLAPVATTIGFLDALKGERGRWAAAVIAGPGPGPCQSAFGAADEAARLRQFTTDAGEHAVFRSICDGDLSGALEAALTTFDAACGSFPPIP